MLTGFTPKHSPSYYFPYLLVLLAIVIGIGLAFIDKGPLLPPFPEGFYSIDCQSLLFKHFYDRNGYLDFEFDTLPSIEYPPEYLPHFISTQITTEHFNYSYSGEQLQNVTKNSGTIKFSVMHPFAGESKIETSCLGRHPHSFNTFLRQIDNYKPDYSRSQFKGNDNAVYNDVCLEYEKFLFFVSEKGNHPNIPFNKTEIRFELLRWPLSAYLKHKNVSMTNKSCFLIAPQNPVTWNYILFTLLPVGMSMEAHGFGPIDSNLMIFMKQPTPKEIDAMSLVSKNPAVPLSDIMCFQQLTVTNTFSSVKNTNEKRIRQALNANVTYLRSRMPRRVANSNYILIDESLRQYKTEIQNEFPDQKVHILKDDLLTHMVDKSSQAKVFVGSHISSLIHLLWMSDDATVIDVSSPLSICNHWADNFVSKIGLHYQRYFTDDQCNCNTFDCYPLDITPVEDIDLPKLFQMIKDGLARNTDL